MNKIYVGNLPYNTNEDELKTVFANYGEIVSVKLITDRETGRSKGFGFIEFTNQEQAKAALDFNGQELQGRPLKVNLAREQRDRDSSGGGRRQGNRW